MHQSKRAIEKCWLSTGVIAAVSLTGAAPSFALDAAFRGVKMIGDASSVKDQRALQFKHLFAEDYFADDRELLDWQHSVHLIDTELVSAFMTGTGGRRLHCTTNEMPIPLAVSCDPAGMRLELAQRVFKTAYQTRGLAFLMAISASNRGSRDFESGCYREAANRYVTALSLLGKDSVTEPWRRAILWNLSMTGERLLHPCLVREPIYFADAASSVASGTERKTPLGFESHENAPPDIVRYE